MCIYLKRERAIKTEREGEAEGEKRSDEVSAWSIVLSINTPLRCGSSCHHWGKAPEKRSRKCDFHWATTLDFVITLDVWTAYTHTAFAECKVLHMSLENLFTYWAFAVHNHVFNPHVITGARCQSVCLSKPLASEEKITQMVLKTLTLKMA